VEGEVSVLGAAAAAFDRAMVQAARVANRRKSRAESLSHDERMRALAAIRDSYAAPEIWTSPDAFFEPPPPIHPALERVRGMRSGGTVYDASWPSRFEPYLPELRNKYLGFEENRTAHARLYLAPQPRATILLVHGYLAGQWHVEERAWPIRWLAERYDLAIAVLPFHALRAHGERRGAPPFPGADPRMTNEGFRQAMFDLRALAAFLRARGAPAVGVMGMSLGGYTTALLATVERGLSFAVPIIPLASLADFALEQGRLGRGEEAGLQHDALEEANRIVSPLARPSLVPSERVLVVAAESDRITPPAHAERLARHFGARIVRFEGGHLLQFGRGDAFRAVGRWLDTL
jgi:pimeloyl-ACP methyl ester carboxylesterase